MPKTVAQLETVDSEDDAPPVPRAKAEGKEMSCCVCCVVTDRVCTGQKGSTVLVLLLDVNATLKLQAKILPHSHTCFALCACLECT